MHASNVPPIKSELNSELENESVEELERRLFRERCMLLGMLRAREERLHKEIVASALGMPARWDAHGGDAGRL